MESLSNLLDMLLSSPLQATVSLVIFLLALPLIVKGLRDRKEGHPDHETPWLMLEMNNLSNSIQSIQRDINSILTLLKKPH